MGSFWLFRSDLRQLEYYHKYIIDLNEFKLNCHDFYLLMSLFFLENKDFDEVIVWRLQPKQKVNDIVFDINGRKFVQKFVDTFKESYIYENPDISFFRGGFKPYCEVTKENPKHFGLKLYLGAGPRVFPKYGGVYDKILIEDEEDNVQLNCIPFYKTSNTNIFKPLDLEKKYDICLISNIKQSRKGTEFIINEISKSDFLKSLKICHIGEFKEVGVDLSKKLNVKNIDFLGYDENKQSVNIILNQSKFGLVSSTKLDGCPRVVTEILTSGTPLIIRDETRLLNFYKQKGVCVFEDYNFENKVRHSMGIYNTLKQEVMKNINSITIDKICNMNLKLWR